MHKSAENISENKSLLAASNLPKEKSGENSTLQLVDNRSSSVAQRKLQELMGNARVKQLKNYQTKSSSANGIIQRVENTNVNSPVVQPMWNASTFKNHIETTHNQRRSYSEVFTDVFFKKQVYVDHPEFTQIHNWLLDYQDVRNKNGAEARKERTFLLHSIQEEAYKWYGKNKATRQNGANTRSPYHDHIINLLNEIKTERSILAAEVVDNKDDIWVPGMDQMDEGSKKGVQDLWKKLIGNKSRLKIRGGLTMQQKGGVYADYMELMSGSYGRSILSRAATGNKKNKSHVITIDPTQGGEPEAEALDQFASQKQLPVNHPQYQNFRNNMGAGLTKAEIGNLRDGPGSGSRIPFRDAPQAGSLYAQGQNWDRGTDSGEYEMMPSFVVLGHELGHAIRQQHGQSTVDFRTPFHQTPQGADWHNLDEQEVITKNENAIRAEHNLGARKYHRASAL